MKKKLCYEQNKASSVSGSEATLCFSGTRHKPPAATCRCYTLKYTAESVCAGVSGHWNVKLVISSPACCRKWPFPPQTVSIVITFSHNTNSRSPFSTGSCGVFFAQRHIVKTRQICNERSRIGRKVHVERLKSQDFTPLMKAKVAGHKKEVN